MKSLSLLKNRNKARLIPAFKKTERKLLSVFLATLEHCPNLRGLLLRESGFNSGKTANYISFMEPAFEAYNLPPGQPDGIICCERGSQQWCALIEAKQGNFQVGAEQIQRYLEIAKFVDADCIISISNEFTNSANELPYHIPANKRRGKGIYHWSWSYLVSQLSQFCESEGAEGYEKIIIAEALAYFHHGESGIQTFDQMPQSWPAFVQSANTSLGFNSQISGLTEIVHAWHQERRDLLIKIDNLLGGGVTQDFTRKLKADETERVKQDRSQLADDYTLSASYQFKSSKTELKLCADLRSCSQRTHLVFYPPDGKKSKATTTWLLKKLTSMNSPFEQIICKRAGRNNDTIHKCSEIIATPELMYSDFTDAPKSIELVACKQDVRRFKSRKRFIEDLESGALEVCRTGVEMGLI